MPGALDESRERWLTRRRCRPPAASESAAAPLDRSPATQAREDLRLDASVHHVVAQGETRRVEFGHLAERDHGESTGRGRQPERAQAWPAYSQDRGPPSSSRSGSGRRCSRSFGPSSESTAGETRPSPAPRPRPAARAALGTPSVGPGLSTPAVRRGTVVLVLRRGRPVDKPFDTPPLVRSVNTTRRPPSAASAARWSRRRAGPASW